MLVKPKIYTRAEHAYYKKKLKKGGEILHIANDHSVLRYILITFEVLRYSTSPLRLMAIVYERKDRKMTRGVRENCRIKNKWHSVYRAKEWRISYIFAIFCLYISRWNTKIENWNSFNIKKNEKVFLPLCLNSVEMFVKCRNLVGLLNMSWAL